MSCQQAVYTSLRVLSALFLLTGFILEIIANTSPLGKYSVTATVAEDVVGITTSISYYLWYLDYSIDSSDHVSYTPGAIVACRALIIVALVFTVLSFSVEVSGIMRHWCDTRVSRLTKVLLYVSLIMSCVALMVLIGFLISFGTYFNTINPESPDIKALQLSSSQSWQGGMKCAVGATVLCFLSTILDCVLLRLSTKMEMAEAQPQAMPDNGQQWVQQPPQAGAAYGQPMGQQPAPAYGEQWGQPPQPGPVNGQYNTYYPKEGIN